MTNEDKLLEAAIKLFTSKEWAEMTLAVTLVLTERESRVSSEDVALEAEHLGKVMGGI